MTIEEERTNRQRRNENVQDDIQGPVKVIYKTGVNNTKYRI